MFSILYYFMTGPSLDGFEQHLADAIEVNTERSARYRERTGGASDGLFSTLILSERLLLPAARVIDAWAVPFVEDGVDIVVGDFVPMEGLRSVDAPIKDVDVMSAADRAAASRILSDVVAASTATDAFAVVDASAEALHALEALEEDTNLYFAMSRHVVESIGFAALHGLYHDCETDGETATLVDALVGLQLLGLSMLDVTSYDQQANTVHRSGVGVLVNDLPPIPFLDEHAHFSAQDRNWLSSCLGQD